MYMKQFQKTGYHFYISTNEQEINRIQISDEKTKEMFV